MHGVENAKWTVTWWKKFALWLEQRSFLLVGLGFVVITANGYGMFKNSNSHKAFLLFVLVTLFFVVIQWWLNSVNHDERGGFPWRWMLLLSMPLLGSMPGLYLSHGELNYFLGHEISVHLAYLLWFSVVFWGVRDGSSVRALFMILGGVVLYVTYIVFFGLAPVDGVVMKSTFGNQNLYSNFIILFLPMMMLYALPLSSIKGRVLEWGQWNIVNGYFLVVSVVALTGLIQVQTRSAVVGLLMVLLLITGYFIYLRFLAAYHIKRVWWVVGGMVLVLVMIGGYYLLTKSLSDEVIESERFLALLDWHAWAGRLMPWETAWNSILSSPWFGYGPGSSYSLAYQFVSPESGLYNQNRNYDHVHNEWLEVGQEGGLLGVLLYLLMLAVVFWVVIRLFRIATQEQKWVVIGLAMGMIAYLFHSSFSIASRMVVGEMGMVTLVAIVVRLLHGMTDHTLGQERAVVPQTIWAGRSIGTLLVLMMWWVGSSSLQRDLDRRHFMDERLGSKDHNEAIYERYKETGRIEILHELTMAFFKVGEIERVPDLLERMDAIIPNFRNVSMMKATEYQLSAGAGIDVRHFKTMIDKVLDQDRFSMPAMHWRARISAWEGDQSRLLELVADLLRYELLSARVTPKWNLENVTVIYSEDFDGFGLLMESGIRFVVGEKQVMQIEQALKKMHTQEEADHWLKEIADQIYVGKRPETMDAQELKKLQQLFVSFISKLAGWSRVPSV